jgi:hypothetical protein
MYWLAKVSRYLLLKAQARMIAGGNTNADNITK